MLDTRLSLKDILDGKHKHTVDQDYDVSLFSDMKEEDANLSMDKYPFSSFEDIPKDRSGLNYPSFEDIEFYPSKLIQEEGYKVIYVDGLAFLRILGDSAFCIDPRRWNKIKQYLAKGHIEYPECYESEFGVMDGRHRTLLMMQIYNRKTVPIAVLETSYNFLLEKANSLNALAS